MNWTRQLSALGAPEHQKLFGTFTEEPFLNLMSWLVLAGAYGSGATPASSENIGIVAMNEPCARGARVFPSDFAS